MSLDKNVIFIGKEVGACVTPESIFVTISDDGTFKLVAINCDKADISDMNTAIECLTLWKNCNGDKNE
jgi:hypothetical protein